jgi:LacI family transcriptional regulator
MARQRNPSRITIRDVAEAAEVHVSTVSRALDPTKSSLIASATRDRVVAVAKELGYQPHLVASGLRRGQTMTVGVVVPDLGNPIFAPLARGATHALEGANYMPLLADTQDDHDRLARILRHLAERRVEAIIITAARLDDDQILVELRQQGIPVVVAIRTVTSSGLPSVLHDDLAGGQMAAQHLLDLGHERLGQVRGSLEVEPFVRRSEGFAATVEAAGAALVPDVEPVPHLRADEGRSATLQLLEVAADRRPTALFVQNDVMALGALLAIRDLGLRCPEDISIVSYNDAFFTSHTHPPLTTVRLDAYQVGQQAGELALELITEPDRDHPGSCVPPELIVRGSTAPPTSPA